MRIRNWDQMESRKDTSYIDEYRDVKEYEILKQILLNAIHNGISHKQLAKAVNLNEKTLRKYIKKLKKTGLIKKGNKLQDKYLPTKESYKDPLSKSYLLGDAFRRKVLFSNKFLVTYGDKSRFREKNLLEHMLLEFSNMVGAYITYALMWSMDPDNNMPNPEQTDELVEKLATNSISRVLPFLVWQFRDSVYRGINLYPSGYEAGVKYMKKNPSLLLSKDIIEQLKKSFLRLYPRIYFELQSIANNLSKELGSEKRFVKDIEEGLKAQNHCIHEYQYNKPKIRPENSYYYYKECRSCGSKKRVTKSEYQKSQRDRDKMERNEKYEPYSL
jgi:predicted transcriptional regulator